MLKSLTNQTEQQDTPKRTCWVCLTDDNSLTDGDLPSTSWLAPCRCRGPTQWVHQNCLQRFVDSKQHGNYSVTVACPECHSDYIIDFPPFGIVTNVLNVMDLTFDKYSLYMIAGVRIGSIYWIAVTYGALTLTQVLGRQEGIRLMGEADPIILLLGLPLIPTALILSRLIRWDTLVLKFWMIHGCRIPLVNYFFKLELPSKRKPIFSTPIRLTRLIFGALILPTMALFTGNIMFGDTMPSFKKTVWGGATYLLIKGVLKLYLRQKHYQRLCARVILNSSEWDTHGDSSGEVNN